MFYPPCPKCNRNTVTSAQSAHISAAGRRAGNWLRGQQLAGHPHPAMKAAYVITLLGNEVYKRVPGGGEKRCTNPECGHIFK